MNKCIEEIARLIAKHKIIPFLGSGCAKRHLKVDWDSLRDDLAKDLGITSADHMYVASEYEKRFGRSELCSFLKKKLLINDFLDELGEIYLAIMQWGHRSIYTTN